MDKVSQDIFNKRLLFMDAMESHAATALSRFRVE
jgi:hypothetical protein